MANQVIVTNTGNVQVALTPPPNVQVQISRAAIGTVSNVPTANFANFANFASYSGNVVNANQPNITGLGTLTSLISSGNITAPYFIGNVVGNISGNLVVPGSNTAVLYNQLGNAGASDALKFDYAANVLTANGNIIANYFIGNGSQLTGITATNANFANFAGNAFSVSGSNVSGAVANATFATTAGSANSATVANSANSVAGANVSGTVANATFAANAGNATIANSANSIAVANVTGIGNIATTNYDGNASNVLYGNGGFYALPTVSNVANANYANFAGSAFSVSGSNVSGAVANATYANDAGNANIANSATVANSANSVAVANVSGIGNIATTNYDGNASNVLYGNGVFATTPIISNVANANYANFAGTAYSVSGANVSGEVANANYSSYANIAATANSVALANVVGIGNIANINLDGSSSNVLFGNGVFAPESTSIANANYANFAGTLINGTSNISIPTANGTIAFSVNNVANLMTLENGGVVNAFPTSSVVNMLRINTFNNSLSDAHRIAWARARGSNTSPTSVQASDRLGILGFFGHNGTSYQTNSISFIRATVDASYTANGANIPIGLQLIVNDTNGGTNNQAKTHQFWANGNVSFANVIFADGGGLSNIVGANVTGQVPYAATANSVAVANVSGIGNIATINLDGNVSNVLTGNGTFVAIPNASANSNYANFAGNLINGTSNISIPTANGTIAFSVNNVANLMLLENGGQLVAQPTGSTVNMLRINTYTNLLGDAHRISWVRARGSNTSPTSVNPNDNLGVLSFLGHNGSNVQTNSVAFVRARVDGSYTANTANIPIGMQILVNDTNGGINNQTKTHNFWANGNVSFSNFVEASSYSATGNIAGGNLSTGGTLSVSGNTSLGTLSTSTSVDIKGNNSTGVVTLNGTQFNVTQTDANGAAGYSPFFFRTFQSNTDPIPASKFFRSRGNIGSSTAVATGDQVSLNQYAVYADSGNTYKRVFEEIVTVTGNDGVGNVTANLDIVSFNTGSNINLQANTYANNVSISSGGFMKLSTYTATALTAITGQVGWMAAVSDSASGGGGGPNGMLAFWDTTNTRWSYIHNNSAV